MSGNSNSYRTHVARCLMGAALISGLASLAQASEFTPVVELSALDGTTGFQISGEAAGKFSGFSVSAAGDFNGDGFGDVIVGAFGADTNGATPGGSTAPEFEIGLKGLGAKIGMLTAKDFRL